jgi:peptidoglycan/LPS O-acetylase OafA/YrhL
MTNTLNPQFSIELPLSTAKEQHPSSEKNQPRSRFAPLDGLRGIAILVVMVLHFFGSEVTSINHKEWYVQWVMAYVRSGWMGVDLFFALSGYLITKDLVQTKTSRYYFRQFYIKRSCRIFPLYYSVLLLVLTSTSILLPYIASFRFAALDDVRSTQWLHWIYASNIAILFNPKIHLGPFGHFWSLAVEEHFYLLWPLLIYFIPARSLPMASLMIAVSSLSLRCMFVAKGWNAAAYCFTLCRLDALTFGAMLAAIQARELPSNVIAKYSRILFFSTLSAITAFAFFVRRLEFLDSLVLCTVIPVVSVLSASAVGSCITLDATSRWHRFLSCRTLVFFGIHSYAMYIIHMPLVLLLPRLTRIPDFGANGLQTLMYHTGATIIGISVTVALSMITWKLIEQPSMVLRHRLLNRFCPTNLS